MTARRSILHRRELGKHAVCRKQEAGNRSRVLQRGARYLRRINNARLDEVLELVGRDVIANVALAAEDFLDDDAAVDARIGAELLERMLNRAAHNLGTDLLVTFELEAIDGLAAAEESNATTSHDAFFNGSA